MPKKADFLNPLKFYHARKRSRNRPLKLLLFQFHEKQQLERMVDSCTAALAKVQALETDARFDGIPALQEACEAATPAQLKHETVAEAHALLNELVEQYQQALQKLKDQGLCEITAGAFAKAAEVFGDALKLSCTKAPLREEIQKLY